MDKINRPNLRIIRIGENKDSQLKGPGNFLTKILEENFTKLKKEMPIKVQEAYRTPEMGPEKKILSSHNNQTLNYTDQRKTIKSWKGKETSNIQK